MTKNSFLLTALLTTTLALPLNSKALAQAEPVSFRPSDAWVSSSSANMGERRCALSTKFNNGFNVRFMGTAKWIQSMDIDFQQNAFESGKSYDVLLSTPSGASASVMGQALSSRVLSLDMEPHKDFYAAIKNAPVLDFLLDGNTFRFYMTGFSGETDSFERCMAGEGDEVKSASSSSNDTPTPSSEKIFVPSDNLVVSASDPSFTSLQSDDFNETVALEKKENAALALKQLDEQIQPPPAQKTVEVPVKITPPEAPVKVIPPETSKDTPEPTKEKSLKAEKTVTATPAQEMSSLEEKTITTAPTSAPVIEVPKAPKADTQQAATVTTTKTAIDYRKMAAMQLGLAVPETEVKGNSDDPAAMDAAFADAKAEAGMAASMTPTPPADTQTAVADVNFKPTPGRRMSEQLAAQINNNPDIADVPDTKLSMTQNGTATSAKADANKQILPDMTPLPVPTQSKPDVKTTSVDLTAKDITPAPAVPVAEPTTQNYKTEIKVHKTTAGGTVDFTDLGTPEETSSSAITPAAGYSTAKAYNVRSSAKVSELEQKVRLLEEENMSLNDDLKTALSASKTENMSISSDNWNLEKVTMRYNEADRQLKRLGRQLQQERAQCAVEKEELETMLFDPQVTNQQQLARLSELDRELQQAQQQLELQRLRYEEQIRMLRGGNTR